MNKVIWSDGRNWLEASRIRGTRKYRFDSRITHPWQAGVSALTEYFGDRYLKNAVRRFLPFLSASEKLQLQAAVQKFKEKYHMR